MRFYLGIDGGGTKTTCAVADESSILATVTTGPSNVIRVGELKARESLQQAVRQACAAAGIAPQDVSRVCIGGSGAARPETAAVVRRLLSQVLSSPVEVAGDMEIALEAAFSDGPGVVVNAGTGSFAYGRNADGHSARAGGWGFAVSDEGSAQWIGRTAIVTLLRDRVLESGSRNSQPDAAASGLLRDLLKTWNISSVDDLIRVANATPAPDFSALFPTILGSANARNNISRQILKKAGYELARIADLVIVRLFTHMTPIPLAAPDPSVADISIPLAMTGGVFRHAPQVREVFYNEVRVLHPGVDLSAHIVDPVIGAVSLARKGSQSSAAAKS
jgi:glucosamine kinase